MKQRLFIFLVLIGMALLLAGLNAAYYVQKPKTPDKEDAPNRSTFNPGSTGTQAFYALLAESGRRVTRWQEPPQALLADRRATPSTVVLTGALRRDITPDEATVLLRWVSETGGRLVVIDREPPKDLLVSTANWQITLSPKNDPALWTVDPSDEIQMTADTPATRPVQPTAFTRAVHAVQPSRFASAIHIERYPEPVS